MLTIAKDIDTGSGKHTLAADRTGFMAKLRHQESFCVTDEMLGKEETREENQ